MSRIVAIDYGRKRTGIAVSDTTVSYTHLDVYKRQTPIGYQTNLIVQGIGNYKFMDFVRIGLPLNIITFIISVILIPICLLYTSACPYFTTSLYDMTEEISCDYSELDSFVIFICMEGSCKMVDNEGNELRCV